MSEYRREIAIAGALAIALILGIASAAIYLPVGSSQTTGNSSTSHTSGGSTTVGVLGPTFTSIACASNSFIQGKTSCVASVSGDPPTGTVSWEQVSGGGKVTFSPSTCTLLAGTCGVAVTQTSAGNVVIAASYNGDASNSNSTAVVAISTGFPSFGVAVDPKTNILYTIDDYKYSLVGINESTGSIVGNVSVPAQPAVIAVNPNTDLVYLLGTSPSSLLVVNGTSFATITSVGLTGLARAIAVNPSTNRVYVASSQGGTVSVIDGRTNTIVAIIPLGGDGIAVNPTTNSVYVTNCAAGTVSVVNGSSNDVVSTIKAGSCPQGVGVNPSTGLVYVANYNLDDSSISVIDGRTNQIVGSIKAGGNPWGVAVNSVTDRVYVTYLSPPSVAVIDGGRNAVISKVPTGGTPFGDAVNPTTDIVYVSNYNFYAIQAIDGATNALIGEPMITIVGVCASIGTGCGGSAFSISVANNGTVDIPPTAIGITLSEMKGGTEIYATFSLITGSMLPRGGQPQTIILPTWSSVTNKTGTFSAGDNLSVLVCLPIGPCEFSTSTVRP